MTQTPQEKLLTELNVKYDFIEGSLKNIDSKLDEKPSRESVIEIVQANTRKQEKECDKKFKHKDSYIPPSRGLTDKQKNLLVNAVVGLVTVVTTVLAMKFGLG